MPSRISSEDIQAKGAMPRPHEKAHAQEESPVALAAAMIAREDIAAPVDQPSADGMDQTRAFGAVAGRDVTIPVTHPDNDSKAWRAEACGKTSIDPSRRSLARGPVFVIPAAADRGDRTRSHRLPPAQGPFTFSCLVPHIWKPGHWTPYPFAERGRTISPISIWRFPAID